MSIDYKSILIGLNEEIKEKYLPKLSDKEKLKLRELFLEVEKYGKLDDSEGVDLAVESIMEVLEPNYLKEANSSLYNIFMNCSSDLLKYFNQYYPDYKANQPVLTGTGILEELLHCKTENKPLVIKALYDNKYTRELENLGVKLEQISSEDLDNMDNIFREEIARLYYERDSIMKYKEILSYFNGQVKEIRRIVPSLDYNSKLLDELMGIEDSEIENKLAELNNTKEEEYISV